MYTIRLQRYRDKETEVFGHRLNSFESLIQNIRLRKDFNRLVKFINFGSTKNFLPFLVFH